MSSRFDLLAKLHVNPPPRPPAAAAQPLRSLDGHRDAASGSAVAVDAIDASVSIMGPMSMSRSSDARLSSSVSSLGRAPSSSSAARRRAIMANRSGSGGGGAAASSQPQQQQQLQVSNIVMPAAGDNGLAAMLGVQAVVSLVPPPAFAAAAAAAAAAAVFVSAENCPICAEVELYNAQRQLDADRARVTAQSSSSLTTNESASARSAAQRRTSTRRSVATVINNAHEVVFTLIEQMTGHADDDWLFPLVVKVRTALVDNYLRSLHIVPTAWTVNALRSHFHPSKGHAFSSLRKDLFNANEMQVKLMEAALMGITYKDKDTQEKIIDPKTADTLIKLSKRHSEMVEVVRRELAARTASGDAKTAGAIASELRQLGVILSENLAAYAPTTTRRGRRRSRRPVDAAAAAAVRSSSSTSSSSSSANNINRRARRREQREATTDDDAEDEDSEEGGGNQVVDAEDERANVKRRRPAAPSLPPPAAAKRRRRFPPADISRALAAEAANEVPALRIALEQLAAGGGRGTIGGAMGTNASAAAMVDQTAFGTMVDGFQLRSV